MILSGLKIDSFGSLNNRRLAFQMGLNVILGPNEAGKSTLLNAIEKLLFMPGKLARKSLMAEMESFLPVGGRPSLGATLEFKGQRESALTTLTRTWGSDGDSRLILPDGKIVHDDSVIREYLDSALPAREGTMKSIFIAQQSILSHTIERLRKNHDCTHELGDMLRKTLYETDGISVDEFRGKIKELSGDYLSRWNQKMRAPERGRGPDNPWKVKVGRILAAYYKKEAIRKKWEETRRFDDKLDMINADIAKIRSDCTKLERYLREHRRIFEDASKCMAFESRKEILEKDYESLKHINAQWPIKEKEVTDLQGALPLKKRKHEELLKEENEAHLAEEHRAIKERLQRVTIRKRMLDDAKKHLGSMTKLGHEELEEIRKTYEKLAALVALQASGRLTIDFESRNEVIFTFKKDNDDEERKELKKDQSITMAAGGFIRIGHRDFQMKIYSGRESPETLWDRIIEEREKLISLMKEWGTENLEGAILLNRKYEEQVTRVNVARKIVEDELEKECFDDLAGRCNEMKLLDRTRPLAQIIEERVRIAHEIELLSRELEVNRGIIRAYGAKYGSYDTLMETLSRTIAERTKVKKELEALSSLPAGVGDAGAFTALYGKTGEELEGKKKKEHELTLQKADLRRFEPDISAEELEGQLREAEEELNSAQKNGEATARILDLCEGILQEVDTTTYEPLRNDFVRYVSQLTSHRYTEAEMRACLPCKLKTADGNVLPLDLLSMGTLDLISLALRLAVAHFFLKNASGFLIMDDPLVNLDPERQKKAAELLEEFSQEKQLLIFTCHPSHADLLKGNLIMMQ